MNKKMIFIIFTLLSASAWSDDKTALANQIFNFCESKSGETGPMSSRISDDQKVCVTRSCSLDSTKATDGKDKDCKINIGAGAVLPDGCVRATIEICGSVLEGGTPSGSRDGGDARGSRDGGDARGSRDGGDARGSRDGGDGRGSRDGGDGRGSSNGSDVIIYDGDLICITKNNGTVVVGKNHACYRECNPRTGFLKLGKRVADVTNPKCIRCMQGLGHTFEDEVLKKAGIAVVTGVGVKECFDAQGRLVSRTFSGLCPDHNGGAGTTTVIRGGAAAGGNGGVVISGGVTGSVGGGIQFPSYCSSKKRKDIDRCLIWMQANNVRSQCASSSAPANCLGGEYNEIMARYDTGNCVNCGAGGRRQSTLSGIAEIVGAIAPPLAAFGSAYVGAQAYQRSNEAWAGAAEVGFQQCQLSQNNYLQYLATNELPGLTPAQQQNMNCNGFGLSQYGGIQNGGLGSYYGAGYSPGFIGGMMGPYGGYNPYGMGGIAGGVSIAGGIQGGFAAGVQGGFAGGYVQGGYAGGYVQGGYAGGYAQGGYAGGIPGGYVGGYAQGGYAGGIPSGYVGGYAQGGYAGGFANGISLAGGYAGGYAQGGYAGGYAQGGYAGGFAGGFAGGYAGGYMAAGQGGGYAGGYAGGYMADYQSSMQASNYDRQMQQQGTAYQMGVGGGGGFYGGAYGSFGAAGYPLNLGM